MKKLLLLLSLVLLQPLTVLAAFGDTTTYVGSLIYGDGKYRTSAYFDFPEDIASDGSGNFYIADTFNDVIRKIDSAGMVSTVVGAGGYGDSNGTATTSKFAHPSAVALDSSNNIYIADAGNGKIKKFSNNRVTTIASGLKRPEGLFIRNNILYGTDYTTNRLFSMQLDGSHFTNITSSLNGPKKLYVRTSADYAYVANANDYTVVRVALSSGGRSVIAGVAGDKGQVNGACTSMARFTNLWGLTVIEGTSLDGDDIYVTDGTGDPGNVLDSNISIQNTADTGKVRVIDLDGSNVPATPIVVEGVTRSIANANCQTYLFAKDSDALAINYPNAITRYGDSVYLLVTGLSNIIRYPLADPTAPEIFAGHDRFQNKNGTNGLPGRPKDLVMNRNKSKIFYTENNQVKYITTANRSIHNLVGNTIDNYQHNDDKAWGGSAGRFSDALSLALTPDETKLYVVDRNNNRIRQVNIHDKTVSYFVGAGEINVGGGFANGYQEGGACPNEFTLAQSGCAYFSRPGGITIDHAGKNAYVADTGNEVIRRIRLTGSQAGQTSLVAGRPNDAGYKDGASRTAQFNVPISITIDNDDQFLYVADRDNNAIRKVRISDGQVTTVTGNPSRAGYLDGRLADAYLNLPVKVYYNQGNVYFAEAGTQMIRVADLTDGAVKLVAGDNNRGFTNGDRDNTQFDEPVGIVRKGNNLLVADSQNDLIRKIDLGDGTSIPYTDPAATISIVSPASNKVAGSSTDTKALRITGSGFRHGAVAWFGSFQATATYVNSDTEISVVIPFGQMAPGYYEVGIQNSDGQIGKALRAYSISDNNNVVPLTDYFIE